MTEREYTVEDAKCEVQASDSRLREADRALIDGQRVYQARVDEAKAEMDREVGKLKGEVERARINLQKWKNYLTNAESDLARGFDA